MPLNESQAVAQLAPVIPLTDERPQHRMSLEDARALARAAELLGFGPPTRHVARRAVSWSIDVSEPEHLEEQATWTPGTSGRRWSEDPSGTVDGVSDSARRWANATLPGLSVEATPRRLLAPVPWMVDDDARFVVA